MKNRRKKFRLSKKDREVFEVIKKSRTEPVRKSERAKFILAYAQGESISNIAKMFLTNRPKVERCIDKFMEYGINGALDDLPRRGRAKEITSDAHAWFLSIACTKPKELGLSYEFWTQRNLAKYIKDNCVKAGHESLKNLSRGTVSKILSKSDIRPHKISYYLKRTDEDFDRKMAMVLHVYKEVEVLLAQKERDPKVVITSYDEKPGIQAIGNVHADLAPVAGEYSTFSRDSHYKRHGTLSLMACIDLLNGQVHAKVSEKHRSKEFAEFLKHIDSIYPKDVKIKLILDNHSAHVSKETGLYLATVPNRFEFVFTPKHASWLNLIEVFFSKMARSLLRGIRVSSKSELIERIMKYIEEVNATPTVFRWKWKQADIYV